MSSLKTFCAPNPCSFVPVPGCECSWCVLRCQPVTLNQFYTLVSLAYQYGSTIFAGVPNIIQHDLGNWLFRQSVINQVPVLFTLIALFIVLMITKVIGILSGILLIIMLIVLTAVCLLWAHYYDTTETISEMMADINTSIKSVFDTYKTQMGFDVLLTLLSPDVKACTPISCTGCPPPANGYQSCPTPAVILPPSLVSSTGGSDENDPQLKYIHDLLIKLQENQDCGCTDT